MFSKSNNILMKKGKIISTMLIAGLTIPSIIACSSIDSFTEEINTVIQETNEITVEDRMNNNAETNKNYEFTDNAESRAEIAKVVDDFYIDLTSYEMPEDELAKVQESYGKYVTNSVEHFVAGEPFTGPNESLDVEASISEYTDSIINNALTPTEKYKPYEGLTIYELLNPTQKLMVNTYMGDLKTFYTYSSRLAENTEPADFTIDESSMIFRDGDIIIPPNAITYNTEDIMDVKNIPLRVVLIDGSWKIDVFNLSSIYHSPFMLKIHMDEATYSSEQSAIIVDKGLNKDWNMKI